MDGGRRQWAVNAMDGQCPRVVVVGVVGAVGVVRVVGVEGGATAEAGAPCRACRCAGVVLQGCACRCQRSRRRLESGRQEGTGKGRPVEWQSRMQSRMQLQVRLQVQCGSPGRGLDGRTAEAVHMIDSPRRDGQLSAEGLPLLHTRVVAAASALARRQGPQALTRRHARSREPEADDFAGARWASLVAVLLLLAPSLNKFTQPIATPRTADGAVARSSDHCPVVPHNSPWANVPCLGPPTASTPPSTVAVTEPHRDRVTQGGHGTSFMVDAAACMRPAAAHAGREPRAVRCRRASPWDSTPVAPRRE